MRRKAAPQAKRKARGASEGEAGLNRPVYVFEMVELRVVGGVRSLRLRRCLPLDNLRLPRASCGGRSRCGRCGRAFGRLIENVGGALKPPAVSNESSAPGDVFVYALWGGSGTGRTSPRVASSSRASFHDGLRPCHQRAMTEVDFGRFQRNAVDTAKGQKGEGTRTIRRKTERRRAVAKEPENAFESRPPRPKSLRKAPARGRQTIARTIRSTSFGFVSFSRGSATRSKTAIR